MTTGVVLAVAMTMAAPAAAGAQTPIRPSTEQQRRQEKISIMEGTLSASVGVAAQRVAKDVKSIDSTAMLFTGDARAKGFMLEGHGVFFYVEVPTLDLSVMISVDSSSAACSSGPTSSSAGGCAAGQQRESGRAGR